MLSPDFGSSVFPICSANPGVSSTTSSQRQRKRVSFSRKLTDVYEIAPRKCKRGLSTSTEQIRNKALRLKREIKETRHMIQIQSHVEADLFDQNEALFQKYSSTMTILQFKKSINSLEARVTELEEATFSMKMETIRIKGLHKQLMAHVEKEQMFANEKSLEETASLAGLFTRTLWPKAGPQKPLFEMSWAA